MCTIALAAVFTLLSILAVTMHLITVLFPARNNALDAALVAAISSTVASIFPGATVTDIEEER